MQTIVITGGSGRIGGYLRARMPRPDRVLRLVGLVPIADPGGGRGGHDR